MRRPQMITRFSKCRPKLRDIAGRTSTLLEIVNYKFWSEPLICCLSYQSKCHFCIGPAICLRQRASSCSPSNHLMCLRGSHSTTLPHRIPTWPDIRLHLTWCPPLVYHSHLTSISLNVLYAYPWRILIISCVCISFGQLIVFHQCSLISLNVLYAYPWQVLNFSHLY
jgi:hypothetical protein